MNTSNNFRTFNWKHDKMDYFLIKCNGANLAQDELANIHIPTNILKNLNQYLN